LGISNPLSRNHFHKKAILGSESKSEVSKHFLFIYLILSFNCAEWGYIVAFTKVLTIYQIYHTWIHPFHLSPPIPRVVSTDTIFSFTHMCTQYVHHIHPPSPFPHLFPLPLVSLPAPPQDLFHPLLLQFCIWKKKKKKNDIFAYLR
jgi:hypothetical protein